jgi:hypothetical protein
VGIANSMSLLLPHKEVKEVVVRESDGVVGFFCQ